MIDNTVEYQRHLKKSYSFGYSLFIIYRAVFFQTTFPLEPFAKVIMLLVRVFVEGGKVMCNLFFFPHASLLAMVTLPQWPGPQPLWWADRGTVQWTIRFASGLSVRQWCHCLSIYYLDSLTAIMYEKLRLQYPNPTSALAVVLYWSIMAYDH
jgi:hypothetical protein